MQSIKSMYQHSMCRNKNIRNEILDDVLPLRVAFQENFERVDNFLFVVSDLRTV